MWILKKASYPDVLHVQGNVPDERLYESLLQPKLFLGLIKSFILDLKHQRRSVREISHKIWAGISQLPVEKSLSGV